MLTGSRSAGPTPSPGGHDRRKSARYAVVEDKAWLGWWDQDAYRTTNSRIIDISQGGALMTVATSPPKDQPVWFCPTGRTQGDDWIEAEVVEAKKKKLFGPQGVRLAFRDALLYSMFKAVVYGSENLDVTRRPQPAWLPEGSEERDWW